MALTLKDIGLKFIIEPSGPSLTDDERYLIKHLQPAGVMFRSRNFLQDAPYNEWLSCYRELVAEIRSLIKRKHVILSIDHEGGRAIRPPAPITRFPYAIKWADSIETVTEMIAIELRALAINLNFAPVADIHSNPDNPVIGPRAFGSTAAEVTEKCLLFLKTLRANGISGCPKHFPGHGDTHTDSHFELPVLELPPDKLKERELVPFKTLINSGADIVMTAHVLYPLIDPNHPATLSEVILK
ncbi:MAG: glycoside hydrolase family 3 protein, partial [Candidatus Dadabacteria bacterium]